MHGAGVSIHKVVHFLYGRVASLGLAHDAAQIAERPGDPTAAGADVARAAAGSLTLFG